MKATIPKLNTAWHASHPMPKNPSPDQRIQWHIDHSKNCHCREIPRLIREEMKKRNIQ